MEPAADDVLDEAPPGYWRLRRADVLVAIAWVNRVCFLALSSMDNAVVAAPRGAVAGLMPGVGKCGVIIDVWGETKAEARGNTGCQHDAANTATAAAQGIDDDRSIMRTVCFPRAG